MEYKEQPADVNKTDNSESGKRGTLHGETRTHKTPRDIVEFGVKVFNERQAVTGRQELSRVESGMLASILYIELMQYLTEFRDTLEEVANTTDHASHLEHDAMANVIIAILKDEGDISWRLPEDKIQSLSAGMQLRVDSVDGWTELELVRSDG